MQKKLIALALASLAGTAFAQTNVTIYGVADATFDYVKTNSGANSGPNAFSEPAHARISTNSSYIGFKGVEDLGNGLKAVFQFENSIGFDAASGSWASRDSYVGLSGGFGTVVAGNLTGPTRALGSALDVNAGATGIGANTGVIGKIGGLGVSGNNATSVFDTRFTNAIAYISPNWSGFNVVAAYIANENKANNFVVKDKDGNPTGQIIDKNQWGYDLGVKYENGPIMVGLTYAEVKDSPSGLKTNDLRLGGSYDFSGKASIRAMYEQVKYKADNGANTETLRQNVWGIGGTFNVTPAGRIIAQYYDAGNVKNTDDNDASRLWEIGYEHSLSKRTLLKAVYADLKNKDGSDNRFGVNPGVDTANGLHSTGFQFGVRHSF